jgi:ribonuclease HII
MSIAAASILAKVTRDRLLLEYHEEYPQYNFAKHKGYGTAEHMDAIRKYGISKVHRPSFLKKL